MYDPRLYPEGVPNPWTPAVHPYPSVHQGPNYVRPVFDMTFSERPYNRLEGLGDIQGPSGRAKLNGIFVGTLTGFIFGVLFAPGADSDVERAMVGGVKGAAMGSIVSAVAVLVLVNRMMKEKRMEEGA